MDKDNLDILKKLRDKLSFVIFALTVKTDHELEFSKDESQGFKDILNQISTDLIRISRSYEQWSTAEEVQEHLSSMAKEFPGASME